MFNFMATVPNVNPVPPGGVPIGPQFTVTFSPGNYYFSNVVTINLPSTGGGTGLSVTGLGDNRVSLILNNNVNKDIFNITSAGSIITFSYMKIEGNKNNQSGTSNCIEINAPETTFYHIELRDCLTNTLRIYGFQGASNAWNIFDDVWILNCGSAGLNFDVTLADIRIVDSKFESCAKGVQFGKGNDLGITIVGNNFNNAGIEFSSGS